MRIRDNKGFWIAASLLTLCFFSYAQEEDKFLRLSIGNPKFKEKVVDITPDIIYSADQGKPVDFQRMIEDMASSRFIYVGESHDNLTMHNIQHRIIEALWAKDQNIALGLEMFPVETQEVLDRWSQGLLSKDEFLREVGWYIHWNMNFAYYEKILDLAKEKKIPVFALNVHREIINKIRMRGWTDLSEEERALVPQPNLSNEEHRLLIRTIFDSTELPHAMKGEGLEKAFEGLYRAQAAWDEVMASNAVQGVGKDQRRMIVLAGSGHLYYNLGINRQVYEKNRLSFKTVIPISIDPETKSVSVAGSLGDYLWGVEEEERPAFPAAGLSFKKFNGLDNLVIDRKPFDGAAKGGDFEKGDIILLADEKSFSDINELRIYLARFNWGDEVNFRLLRGGETKDVILSFMWPPREEKPVEEKKGEAKKAQASSSQRIDRLSLQIQRLLTDAGGEVGVAVKHIESGEKIFIAADHHFPMASVFKIPILVEVLAQVKEGRFSLDEEIDIQKKDLHLGSGMISSLTAPGIRLSVRNLVNLMMMISDNSATDILLEKVGAENVNKRLRAWRIEGITVNRSCQELILDFAGLDYERVKGLSIDEFSAEYRRVIRRNPEEFKEAVRRFSEIMMDQSTPRAMNLLLEKIFKKEILDEESSTLILSIMLACQTGESRIKGQLPRGTEVAHKTGTIGGTVNDCGIIYLPDGRGNVVLSILTKNFMGRTAEVEDLIAGIARLVYDYFYFVD